MNDLPVLLRVTANRAARYLESLDERGVAPTADAVDALTAFDVPLQNEPLDPARFDEEPECHDGSNVPLSEIPGCQCARLSSATRDVNGWNAKDLVSSRRHRPRHQLRAKTMSERIPGGRGKRPGKFLDMNDLPILFRDTAN